MKSCYITHAVAFFLILSMLTMPPAVLGASQSNDDTLTKAVESVGVSSAKDFAYTNAKGARTTITNITTDPKAIEDGFYVEKGAEKLFLRGELIDEGKKGLLLIATYFVNGQVQSGQVVTIRPGMTKNEIQQRIDDLQLSFSQNFANKTSSEPTLRKTASASSIGCIVASAVIVGIAAFATKLSKSLQIGVVYATVIAMLYARILSDLCTEPTK